jgi:arabinan endo-1,5-alpha-L-arabinosidase
MFATFETAGGYRGTQILVSDNARRPFAEWFHGPVTPDDWECLDGTLHIDEDEKPWIVFPQGWTQVHNGAMSAQRLNDDLSKPAGRPVFLFNASEAP